MKNDNEFLDAILTTVTVLPNLFSSDVAIAITDLEKYIYTRQAKTFDLCVEEDSIFPKEGVCDIAIRNKKKSSKRYPKEVFGFPVNCYGVPLINPETDHVVGTLVYCLSLEQENKIYEMASELQAFSEELTASSKELADSTQDISSNNQNVGLLIKETTENINSLDGIVSYIRSVADNTNMLGLNAAIEAARVGENGRGFGVVANEIRKLSTSSKSSAEKIKSTLEQMKENITSILEALNSFSSISSTQAVQAEQIASGSERLSDISSELSVLTEMMNQ